MSTPVKTYPSLAPSVPIFSHSIFTHLLTKDGELIGGHAPELPAFTDAPSGTTITRRQLRDFSLALGHGLKSLGAQRGDTVLVFSPNSLNYPVLLLGALSAGLRCTLANNAYTSHELVHQYTDSRAHFVFSTEDGLPTVRAMFKEIGVGEEGEKRIIVLSNSLAWAGGPDAASKPESAGLPRMEDLLSSGSLEKEEKFDGDLAHETAFLCYSSGTTGKPKGVETTHQNLTSVVDIVNESYPHEIGGSMLGFLPFYHIYGSVMLLFLNIKMGDPCYIMPRFDPVQFCSNIQKYKIPVVLVVPPVLVFLSRHPVVQKFDFSVLKLLISGAAPLGPDLTKQVTERFRSMNADVAVVQGFGMTESSPTTHLLPMADAATKTGSIGVLLSNLEARLVDEGVDAEEGKPGELWIKGPTIMKGYLNNEAATKHTITEDGWFKTGDVAIRDKEGHFFIVDRVKELIKYKGFQVPPAELESVLLGHPEVADAAVIGVYDHQEATELPRAYVVHAEPHKVTTDELKLAFGQAVAKSIESKVARHKFLRGGVVVIDVVPKSAAGKILRRELRERAKVELASGIGATSPVPPC
ncbi:AMP binding protein [Armillaria luteobubalina]|uniref:AMP binding protein n=1 Tax=Armillaria luteobubalina TaxID=153913 RepID=A0AA39Q8K1_9AGAR|nr:AMP binding protein [Armillaria luteobubalina]